MIWLLDDDIALVLGSCAMIHKYDSFIFQNCLLPSWQVSGSELVCCCISRCSALLPRQENERKGDWKPQGNIIIRPLAVLRVEISIKPLKLVHLKNVRERLKLRPVIAWLAVLNLILCYDFKCLIHAVIMANKGAKMVKIPTHIVWHHIT